MKIRKIGDPVLRDDTQEVTEFDKNLKDLVSDMVSSMIESDGIGLAAPQVGISKRLFVVGMPFKDEEGNEGRQVFAFINPEITWESDEIVAMDEGCLSIPEIFEEVERPEKVRIKFQDLDGKDHEIEAEGIMARVIQHEYDHLDGILFVDYLSSLKKTMLRNKLKKIEKEAKEELAKNS